MPHAQAASQNAEAPRFAAKNGFIHRVAKQEDERSLRYASGKESDS